MKSTDVPSLFVIPWANAAGASYIRNIPIASQIGIIDGAASLTDGFVPDNFIPTGAGGVPPFGQDFNGIFKWITLWSQWQGANGPVIYNSAFSTSIGGYPKGTVLNASTDPTAFWICTVEDNVTNPDAGGAGWTSFRQPGQLLFSDVGVKNALKIAPTPAPASWAAGPQYFMIQAAFTSDGPCTVDNGSGTTKAVTYDAAGTAMLPGAIVAGSIYWFSYDGTRVQILNPTASPQQPIVLTAAADYYVNPSTGNDSNNGSSTAPWQTIQHAHDWLQRYVDLAGQTVTIHCADGTYGAGLVAQGNLRGQTGTNSLVFLGNTTTPANALLSLAANQTCFSASAGAQFKVRGFKLVAPGVLPGAIGLSASGSGSQIYFDAVDFGACGYLHIGSTYGASVQAVGNYTISGGAQNHYNASVSGNISVGGFTTTLSGTPAFSSAFAQTTYCGVITVQTQTYTGAATGSRYAASANGVIYTGTGNVNYFPGSTAGSTATGGQYL